MNHLLSLLNPAQVGLLGADFHVGTFALQLLLFASSFWLIFLVLIQRGKGGGLTGALGGSGGSSAFGAKAGDAFTRITVISAAIWIFLCMLTIATVNPPPAPLQDETEAMMSALEADDESDTEAEGSAAGSATSTDPSQAGAAGAGNGLASPDPSTTESAPPTDIAPADDSSFDPSGGTSDSTTSETEPDAGESKTTESEPPVTESETKPKQEDKPDPSSDESTEPDDSGDSN